MSSRSDLIVDRIVDRLKTIKISAGYSIDVKTVEPRIIAPEQMPASSFPILFVTDGDKKKVFSDVNELEVEFDVIVTGIVNNPNNAETSRRKLEEAVEICLTNLNGVPDYFLRDSIGANDLCLISILPASSINDKGSMKPYGFFDSTFKIKYFQEFGTP